VVAPLDAMDRGLTAITSDSLPGGGGWPQATKNTRAAAPANSASWRKRRGMGSASCEAGEKVAGRSIPRVRGANRSFDFTAAGVGSVPGRPRF